MQVVYTLLWLAIALLLIFRFGRENKIFYVAAGFFLLMAAVWGYGAATGLDMLHGQLSWVMRGVAALALLLLLPCFIKRYRSERRAMQQRPPQEEQAEQEAESDTDETD